MSEVFTVFYSWQNDTPRRHCRDLVRESLDIAADAISQDPSVPFKVLVQSDTENEPGLCNIPETILRRLRESDAIVSDLTFIAGTDASHPKLCSNPNVLFELGYAFANIGPERLICVMNEAHGPAAAQIFDLAHHRRPISFASPREGTRRAATVKGLARSLEAALRDVMGLGLVGGYGGDDEILFQRQLSDIQSFWRSAEQRDPNFPSISIWFRPKLFRSKRWPDAGSIESLLQRSGPHIDRFSRYPPQPTGNAPMEWGLYNDTYGDPWTLTYSGQFWTEIGVGGHRTLPLSERERRVSPEPPEREVLEEGEWVMADYALTQISAVFQLARNLMQQSGDSETWQLGLEATNIRGRWLHFDHGSSMGPCKAPRITRQLEMAAAEFREGWLDLFVTFGKDFCDLFCRDGRVLTKEDVKHYCNVAGKYE